MLEKGIEFPLKDTKMVDKKRLTTKGETKKDIQKNIFFFCFIFFVSFISLFLVLKKGTEFPCIPFLLEKGTVFLLKNTKKGYMADKKRLYLP